MSVLNSLDKNMPILVVDDFPTMRRIIKNCLKSLGFENVTEAEDGKVAWDKIQNNEFKFIVSDWNMPHMMGIDLLRQVRAEEKTKSIPFLIVATESQKENIIEATTVSSSSYLVKPITAELLENRMETMFKTQR
jgi:two-component system chemotaxis response regulator CheY